MLTGPKNLKTNNAECCVLKNQKLKKNKNQRGIDKRNWSKVSKKEKKKKKKIARRPAKSASKGAMSMHADRPEKH